MKFAPLVVGVAVIATLAACSSSKSSNTPATAASGTGSGSAAATPAGTPINVGNIGSYTGPVSASLAGAQQTIKAWADSVNDAGGINGHPIKLFVKDDGGNPTAGLAAAKELVEQDHVVAIVGEQSAVEQGFGDYVKSKGVPVVGGFSIAASFLTNSDFFPSGTNTIALGYAGLTIAKKNGPTFGNLYCAEAPSCKLSSATDSAVGETIGVKLGYSAAVSASAADYTAVCQGLKQSGVKSYFIADSSAIVLRVSAACAQQGVTAKLVPLDGIVTQAFATTPGLDGITAAEINVPFADSSIPATQAYQAAIAKYAPNLGNLNGPNALYSWVAGKLFEAAVKGSGSTDVTSASVIKGLYSLKDETLGGLAPPLNYTQGQPSLLVNCAFTMEISGGKFITPNGITASTCAPNDVVASIASKLGR